MRWPHLALVLLLTCTGAAGCTTTVSDCTHADLAQASPASPATAAPAPQKVLLLPVKVEVYEVGVGGSAEEVPEWSRQGRELVDQYTRECLVSLPGIVSASAPVLSDAELGVIDQHRALYEAVAANRLFIRNIPAWQPKIDHPDDTIGNGLASLKARLGADALLIVAGYDYCTTAGRKVAAVLAAALYGAAVPMGHSVLHVGLVDLERGDVLWTDTTVSDSYSLKTPGEAQAMVRQAFSNFPAPAGRGGRNGVRP